MNSTQNKNDITIKNLPPEIQKKFKLIQEVGEEIITEKEIVELLQENRDMTAYDGFEPSGIIHIAQGLLRAININKMIDAGFSFKMLIADWHAKANHKYGGDLEKIRIAGKYFIEVWKASGMNLDKVEFIWANDLVKEPGYWELVTEIATKLNLPRVLRTVQIMGRSEKDTLTASQIIYPLMQATDIFKLGVDIAQLGMDQRKVNMLAREIAPEIGYKKPIVVSHKMLLGLLPPKGDVEGETAVERAIRMKMSKSIPDSSIFMTDDAETVNRKIKKAWCPEGEVKDNPMLEYSKYLIFNRYDEMLVERPEKYGGDVLYKSYEELESDFANKKLFPLDLKNAVTKYINEMLEPVRKHFEEDERAKKLKEQVESFKVTR